MRTRLDTRLVAAKIAEAAIRKALGLPYSLDGIPSSLQEVAREVVEEASRELTVINEKGILRCGLCGKGPFTRKGLYLHIRRVHIDVVEEHVMKLLEEKLWSLRSAPGSLAAARG